MLPASIVYNDLFVSIAQSIYLLIYTLFSDPNLSKQYASISVSRVAGAGSGLSSKFCAVSALIEHVQFPLFDMLRCLFSRSVDA